jgi:hypothetical protein
MNELERALRELDVEWPATPDLATAVSARIATPVQKRVVTWRARLASFAAALVLLGGGTLAASPEARSTVQRWLGLKSVEIRREPLRPGVGRELDLGTPIALPPGTRVPSTLGTPDAVYRTPLPDGTRAVSLVYAGPPKVLVQTFRAAATPFIEKSVGAADDVERLEVDGARAYWITGAHGFAYQSATGFGYERQRLADRTLLIERDGLLIRVEGEITKTRAEAIAASVD